MKTSNRASKNFPPSKMQEKTNAPIKKPVTNLFFAIEFLKSDNFLLFFIVFSLCPFQYSWQHFYWYNILYNLVSLLYMSWRLTHHGKKGLDRCFLDIPFLILALLRWLSESMSNTLNISNKYLSIYLLGLLSRVQFFLFDFSVFCNLDRLRIFLVIRC